MPSTSPARQLAAAANQVGFGTGVAKEFDHEAHVRELKRAARSTPSLTIRRRNKAGEPR